MLLQLSIVLLLGKDASSSSYDINFSRLGPVFDGVGAISGGGVGSRRVYLITATGTKLFCQINHSTFSDIFSTHLFFLIGDV